MFYERLVQLCKENGLDVTDFIKSLGMSSGNTGHWKNGKIPGRKKMDMIAERFNVTTDYLLGKTDIKEKPSEIEGFSSKDIEIAKKIQSLTPEQRLKLEGYIDSLLNK